jgi:tetratricopeptide (TPR) repeat protein
MSDTSFSSPNSTLQGQMRQGIILARSGDRTGAEEIFDAILAQHPDFEEALVWKAAIVRDTDQAVACLEKVLQINPENNRARVGLEWAYKRQQETRADNTMTPFENPQLATLNDNTPAHYSAGRRRYAEPEDLTSFHQEKAPSRQDTNSFRPNVMNGQTVKNSNNSETISQFAPYKKRRLETSEQAMPPVDLPPEAVEWTKPRQNQTARNQPTPRSDFKSSRVFQAASPKIAFSVSPKITWARRTRINTNQERTLYPLRLPLGLFGIALALALLTFPFNGNAPLLGTLAFLVALIGVFLFNRARL